MPDVSGSTPITGSAVALADGLTSAARPPDQSVILWPTGPIAASKDEAGVIHARAAVRDADGHAFMVDLQMTTAEAERFHAKLSHALTPRHVADRFMDAFMRT